MTVAAQPHPFEDLINLLSRLAPEEVLAFKPSEASVKRVQWLLDAKQNRSLTFEEIEELDRHILLEDLMVIAKARARLELKNRA
jgi:hypothetical protein